MPIEKIDDGALYEENRFHCCLDDVPGMSADEMQEFMDYIPRNVLIPKVNELIDTVEQKDSYTRSEADLAFSAALMGKALGNPVYISDMIKSEHSAKITVLGKNLMTYPYCTESGTINGITYTVQEDGSVVLDGTATATSTFLLVFDMDRLLPDGVVPGEQYTISCTADKEAAKCNFTVNYYNEPPKSINYLPWLSISVGNSSKTAFLPEDAVAIRAYLSVTSGAVVDSVTVYPQLERGESATAFAPFTESTALMPLTVMYSDGESELTADENGEIPSFVCKAPSVQISCDDDSVILQCEYIRDINSAFEQLIKQIKGA